MILAGLPDWALLTIAIAIIVILLIVFFVSFVAYKRLPPPKGCEDLEINEEKCAGCANITCTYHKRAMKQDDESKEKEK